MARPRNFSVKECLKSPPGVWKHFDDASRGTGKATGVNKYGLSRMLAGKRRTCFLEAFAYSIGCSKRGFYTVEPLGWGQHRQSEAGSSSTDGAEGVFAIARCERCHSCPTEAIEISEAEHECIEATHCQNIEVRSRRRMWTSWPGC